MHLITCQLQLFQPLASELIVADGYESYIKLVSERYVITELSDGIRIMVIEKSYTIKGSGCLCRLINHVSVAVSTQKRRLIIRLSILINFIYYTLLKRHRRIAKRFGGGCMREDSWFTETLNRFS